jgi:hypothetical protein
LRCFYRANPFRAIPRDGVIGLRRQPSARSTRKRANRTRAVESDGLRVNLAIPRTRAGKGGELIPAGRRPRPPTHLCRAGRNGAARLPATNQGRGSGRIGSFAFRCALTATEVGAASGTGLLLSAFPATFKTTSWAVQRSVRVRVLALEPTATAFPFSGRRSTGRATRCNTGSTSRFRIRVRVSDVVDVYALLLHVVVALPLPNGRIRVPNSPRACSIQDAASELRRIPIPRTRVHRGEKKGRSTMPRPFLLRLPFS